MQAKYFGIALAATIAAGYLIGQPPTDAAAADTPANAETVNQPAEPAVAIAREQAVLMHRLYASTLEAIHHHYFHGNRRMIPARAMEDIFADLEHQTGVKAKWIAVNTRAMGVDHTATTAFEKEAVKGLKQGQPAVEQVDAGVFRRATPIPLGSSCISCHTGLSEPTDKFPRFAGLVLELPLTKTPTAQADSAE